jgi:AraC family transcriptional regulator
MTSKKDSIKPDRIEKNTESMLIAGISRKMTFNDGLEGAAAQWEEFGSHLGGIPGQKNNISFGLCYDMENGKGIEYVTGVEVSEADNLPNGFATKRLPNLDYAVFEHEGHVSEIPKTCDAIMKAWAPGSGYKKPKNADFFFERYGEGFDPIKGIGDIEIWVPIEE